MPGPSITCRIPLKQAGYKAASQPCFLTRRDEDVPRPADRLDGLRVVGVVLDLAPQARDADVDRAVEGLPFAVAGQREELVARQHPVRVLGEGAQQVELHRRERDVLAARA